MLRIFAYIGISITIGIVLIGSKKYRSLPKEMKFLFWFFVFDLSTSLLGSTLSRLSINNHWLSQIQTPVMYGCYTWVLSHWVGRETVRTVLLYTIPLFLVIWGFSSLNIESWQTFNIITQPLVFTWLLMLAIIVVYFTLQESVFPLFLQSRFWICMGLILYCVITITSMLFAKHLLVVSEESLLLVWTIRNLISVIAYLFFAVGFLCVRKINSGNANHYSSESVTL